MTNVTVTARSGPLPQGPPPPNVGHDGDDLRISRLHWRTFRALAGLGLILGCALAVAVTWLRSHPELPLGGWARSVHLSDMSTAMKAGAGLALGLAITTLPMTTSLLRAAEERSGAGADLGLLGYLRQLATLGVVAIIALGTTCLWFSIARGREALNGSIAFAGSLACAAVISVIVTAPDLINGPVGHKRRHERAARLREAAGRLAKEQVRLRSLILQAVTVGLIAGLPCLVALAAWSDHNPHRLVLYALFAASTGLINSLLAIAIMVQASYLVSSRDTGVGAGLLAVLISFVSVTTAWATSLDPRVPTGAIVVATGLSVVCLLAPYVAQVLGPDSRLRLQGAGLPGGRPVAEATAQILARRAAELEGSHIQLGPIRTRVHYWHRWITGA